MTGMAKLESHWSVCEIGQKTRKSCRATVDEFRACEEVYREHVRARAEETCAETEANFETMREIVTHPDCDAYSRKC